tara:strand:- start:379 stop:561 length:183 start_codon:yes stop_codon:yes gene_type:complete
MLAVALLDQTRGEAVVKLPETVLAAALQMAVLHQHIQEEVVVVAVALVVRTAAMAALALL